MRALLHRASSAPGVYRALAATGGLGLVLLLGGCSAILGIEDRSLRSDAEGGASGMGGPAAGGSAASGMGGSAASGMGGGISPPPTAPPVGPPIEPGGLCSGSGSGGFALPVGDPLACADCLCGTCGAMLDSACSGGGCEGVLDCIIISGCADPATCALDVACGPVFDDLAPSHELLDCVNQCPRECRADGYCVEGSSCFTPDGTTGLCMGGSCDPYYVVDDPCAGMPDLSGCSSSYLGSGVCLGGTCGACRTTQECEGAYGAASCCGPSGQCESCSYTSCADGQACGWAPTPTGQGLCMGGQCVECTGPAGAFDDTCMNNVGGDRLCCSAAYTCERCPMASGCSDGIVNGNETDTDCGGPDCAPCRPGLLCSLGTDCESYVCGAGSCASAVCDDTVQNGNETGVDCGGPDCAWCRPGEGCSTSGDCDSSVCAGGTCQSPSCTDGVRNGAESDLDCGGGCVACPLGSLCNVPGDCITGYCTLGLCNAI